MAAALHTCLSSTVSTEVSRIWQLMAAADSNHNSAAKSVFHDQAMTVKFHIW